MELRGGCFGLILPQVGPGWCGHIKGKIVKWCGHDFPDIRNEVITIRYHQSCYLLLSGAVHFGEKDRVSDSLSVRPKCTNKVPKMLHKRRSSPGSWPKQRVIGRNGGRDCDRGSLRTSCSNARRAPSDRSRNLALVKN